MPRQVESDNRLVTKIVAVVVPFFQAKAGNHWVIMLFVGDSRAIRVHICFAPPIHGIIEWHEIPYLESRSTLESWLVIPARAVRVKVNTAP